MKLQRTTLILILLALSLAGFVYFYEIYWKNQQEEVREEKRQLFSFEADDVQSLTIKSQTGTVNLERNNSDRPKWLMKSPEQSPAMDASVSYLMDLLVKGTSNRTLSVTANQLGEFGLDNPQGTVEVKLKNQKIHRIFIGKPDFNNRFLYAQIDPMTTNGKVDILLVSTDFANAVNRQLSEWKAVDNSVQPSLNIPSANTSPEPIPTGINKPSLDPLPKNVPLQPIPTITNTPLETSPKDVPIPPERLYTTPANKQ
jgi:hypothetical protein